MTPPNVTKDSVRVTKVIDELIWAFPESSPRKIAELLTYRLYPSEPLEKHYNEVKTYYSNMISVRKSQLKKWRATKVYGRPQKALVSAHRVEWEVEQGLPVDLLVKVKATAGGCRPRVEDVKPVGVWYVIPNRNRQLEYHDAFVSVRVMPQSGTVRILPAVDLDYKEFEDRVWDAFLKAELTSKECDQIAQALRVSDRHKTFRIGPVTPFKVDHYKESLGLTILADGSHPEFLEVIEGWPSWPRPLISSIMSQIQANGKQTEAITLLTEQIRLHLEVMKGIDTSTRLNAEATKKLAEVVDRLYRLMGFEKSRRRQLTEKDQKKLSDFRGL
jgi:hypothetical protein